MAAKPQRFNERLRVWRKARGWMQKEAADKLRVGLSTYQQWEQGWTKPSRFPNMTEILSRMEALR